MTKKLSCQEVVKAFVEQIKKCQKYNAVLEIFDDVEEKAKEMIDEKIGQGFKGKLAGVPIIIKDNILYEGKICSCSSKFLKDFVCALQCNRHRKSFGRGGNNFGQGKYGRVCNGQLD